MSLTARMNNMLHPLLRRYLMRAYAKKSYRVEKQHPDLFKPVAAELSARHRALWSRTGLASGDRWLRLHVNLTGIEDYTFCPEDIFFARIERVLNDCDQGGYGPDDKLNLFRYVPKENEPETIVRYVRGSFYDSGNNWLDDDGVNALLQGDLVGKPCRASGGSGVSLRGDITAEWIRTYGGESYVVQRKIEQCDFSAQFNRGSVNTVRMMTMRCPWNGELVVCRSMMRMGVTDSIVDNMMKGGLCVCVGDKGQLGKYAYDYNGKRFVRHPTSGLSFEGLVHPGYHKMVETAFSIHRSILDFNLMSFDLVQRNDGSICVVELNATSQGITQLQYDFGGLFGAYSEKVAEWVGLHQKFDAFSHFKTWY